MLLSINNNAIHFDLYTLNNKDKTHKISSGQKSVSLSDWFLPPFLFTAGQEDPRGCRPSTPHDQQIFFGLSFLFYPLGSFALPLLGQFVERCPSSPQLKQVNLLFLFPKLMPEPTFSPFLGQFGAKWPYYPQMKQANFLSWVPDGFWMFDLSRLGHWLVKCPGSLQL